MIGCGNGNISEKVRVSVDNPFVERYVRLLNSLNPVSGHFGIVFEDGVNYSHVTEGNITEDDYNFLKRMMIECDSDLDDDYDQEEGDEPESVFIVEEKDEKFASEFIDGIRGVEYSFLVFQGVELFYYDENGKKHKTKIK